MRARVLSVLLALAITSGCGWWEERSGTTKGSVYGAGEARPVATNDTTTGRAMNRRVEITIRPDEALAAESRESERGAPSGAPVEEPR